MKYSLKVFSIVISLCMGTALAQALDSPIPSAPPEQANSQNSQQQAETTSDSVPEYSDIEVIGPNGSSSSSKNYDDVRTRAQQTGEYTIVEGDSLWVICDRLLDNPWYWPKLWKLNQYIVNPDLIYAGDKLFFYEGSTRSFPDMGFSNKKKTLNNGNNADQFQNNGFDQYDDSLAANQGAFLGNTVVYQDDSKIVLRPIYFLEERKPQIQGYISHALANKRELSESDRVYIKMKKGVAKPKKGDRFYVIEKISKLRANQRALSGKLYGHIIRKNAVIEVTSVGGNTIEAVIIGSDHAVNRQFELIAYRPQTVSLDVEEVRDSIKAKILGVTNEQLMIRDGDYVFIDQGQKENLKPGTVLYAVRKGDPLVPSKDNENLPELTYGKLVVAEVYNNSAMAYVTDVRDALEVGETLKTFVE